MRHSARNGPRQRSGLDDLAGSCANATWATSKAARGVSDHLTLESEARPVVAHYPAEGQCQEQDRSRSPATRHSQGARRRVRSGSGQAVREAPKLQCVKSIKHKPR
jgi:hypothetical protein